MKPCRFCHKCRLIAGTLPALLAGWLRIWQEALKINSAGGRRLWGCRRPFFSLHIPDNCSYWKWKPAATVRTPHLNVSPKVPLLHSPQQGACQLLANTVVARAERHAACRILLDLSSNLTGTQKTAPCLSRPIFFSFTFFVVFRQILQGNNICAYLPCTIEQQEARAATGSLRFQIWNLVPSVLPTSSRKSVVILYDGLQPATVSASFMNK